MIHATHEVLNPSTPFVDVSPFETDAGLRDALRLSRTRAPIDELLARAMPGIR
jgi:hypothetical protein